MGVRHIEPLLCQADGTFYNYATASVTGSAFALGVTQPVAANTGYAMAGYTSSTLVDVAGDVTLTTGQTLQGKRVHGAVYLSGDNITVQGCHIVGRAGAAYNANYRGLITNTGSNNVVQFCTLTQWDASTSTDQSIYWREGVYMIGGSLTVYRNDISNTNHLTYTTAGALTVRGNYLHEPGFRNDDADHSSDSRYPNYSHNDGVHLAGGSTHDVYGNNFVMKFSTQTGMASTLPLDPAATNPIYPNCHGMLLRQANSTLPGVKIRSNWFAYGSIAMQFTDNTLNGGGGDYVITGNRITPNQGYEYGAYQQIQIDTVANWPGLAALIDSTNVYSQDSDTPLAWRGQPLKTPTGSSGRYWAYNSSAHTP